jgi:hypothetical protein
MHEIQWKFIDIYQIGAGISKENLIWNFHNLFWYLKSDYFKKFYLISINYYNLLMLIIRLNLATNLYFWLNLNILGMIYKLIIVDGRGSNHFVAVFLTILILTFLLSNQLIFL